MRYPTHVSDTQTTLSPIMNLVNRVFDLSGNTFSASNIEYNYTNTRELAISGPLTCTLASSIRTDNNRSTELKKPNERFGFDSAVIKGVLPSRDQVGTKLKLYNNTIEFTNPRIDIPTSVITTDGYGKIQGIINVEADVITTSAQITNMVTSSDPAPTYWECTVNDTTGFIVGKDIQITNVGATEVSPSPYNTGSIITAQVIAIPSSTLIRIKYSGTGSVSGPGSPIPILSSSNLIQTTVNITDAFLNLQELILTISGGKGIPDLSGACAPALVSAEDDSLYFVYISRYTSNIGYLGYSNSLYDIVFGHILPNGTLDWIHRVPGLVTTRQESTPVITIGDNNDIYIAYMTTGATSGNLNGNEIYIDTSTYGICGCANPSSCTACGYEDIVLARINPIGATASIPPTVVWKIQNGYINSIYQETRPSICIDTTNQLLYLAYQCNKNLACFTSLGSSNILLHCFTMSGGQHLWVKAQTEINTAGANTAPAIACDNTGNVYIAYEITAPASGSVHVDGGADIPANEKQIEVVRFQTMLTTPSLTNTFNPSTTYLYGTWVYYPQTAQWYQVKSGSVVNEPPPGSSKWSEPYPVNVFFVQRVWVLSQAVNIFAVGGCDGDNASQPKLVADRSNGNVFLTFLTTGQIMNFTNRSGCGHELVIMNFTKDRVVRWIYQGGDQLNPSEINYVDCNSPWIMMDRYGNLLFSLLTTLASGKVNMAIFHYDQAGNTRWKYPRSETETYPAYMWARTNSPNAVFLDSVSGSFSGIGIGKAYTQIFFGTITDLLAPAQIQVGLSGTKMICISRFVENIYYTDRNAFSYMVDVRSICSCGIENCGCF
jgi:hypothetical protein